MEDSAIYSAQMLFLALLLFVIIFAVLARKLDTPYPIVLVVAGLVISLIPGIPDVKLNPDFVFYVVLPPLLYSAAWLTSWREFRFNIVSIMLLAFGLVGFTALGVAITAHWAFPGFDWRLGFVLGAVVATTDAIAAASIAKKIGLPKRIVDILEGESLVNDATGLVALEFGVAMVVAGRTPAVGEGLARLAYLVVAGIALGLLIGLVVEWFERRVEDGPIEITISIFVPYATYFAAERMHASGVLAVVACGLYLSRKSSQFFTPSVRIQAWAVWDALTFVLNGLVFVAIGLQLQSVLQSIHGYRFRELFVYGTIFSAIVILLRLIWMYPGAHLSYWIRRKLLRQNAPTPEAKGIFVVGWTGMRGVVSLAAAISLPSVLADGSPFPKRDLIIFLTFFVIFVTLVLQGLTLPAVIRALGLAGTPGRDTEEEEARRRMIAAAKEHLQKVRQADGERFAPIHDEMEQIYQRKSAGLIKQSGDTGDAQSAHHRRRRELMRELLSVERDTALQLRDQGEISDEVLRQIEHELDLSETRLSLVR